MFRDTVIGKVVGSMIRFPYHRTQFDSPKFYNVFSLPQAPPNGKRGFISVFNENGEKTAII